MSYKAIELEGLINLKEAANIIGCSTRTVRAAFETGQIDGKWVATGQRKVRRVYESSVKEFALRNKNNPHIGRKKKAPANRKPIINKGYRLIYKPDHPNAHYDGYVQEHYFVMSEHLKRPIKKAEIIHHKNRDKLDNRIENLELFENMSAHQKHHFQEFEKGKPPTRFNRAVEAIRGDRIGEDAVIRYIEQLTGKRI